MELSLKRGEQTFLCQPSAPWCMQSSQQNTQPIPGPVHASAVQEQTTSARERDDDGPHLGLIVHKLPLDILEQIVSYIPRRPRVLVVSRICKRWREAVLRTIDHFDSLRWRAGVNIEYLLRNVTSLTTDILAEPFVPPPRLSKVTLALSYEDNAVCDKDRCASRHFVGLTTINDLTINPHCSYAIPLFQSLRTSLTSLSIASTRSAVNGFPDSFGPITLPSLRQLNLINCLTTVAVTRFLSAHASQLTHLSCIHVPDSLQFPRLKFLQTGELTALVPDDALISITNMKLTDDAVPPRLPHTSSLTSLWVHAGPTTIVAAALEPYFNLTSLTLNGHVLPSDIPTSLTRLRLLRFTAASSFALPSHLTTLTCLQYTDAPSWVFDNGSSSLILPLLMSLHIAMRKPNLLPHYMPYLLHRLKTSPRLRVLSIGVIETGHPVDEAVAAVKQLVQVCESKRLEQLIVPHVFQLRLNASRYVWLKITREAQPQRALIFNPIP